jgi:hypothetical protein
MRKARLPAGLFCNHRAKKYGGTCLPYGVQCAELLNRKVAAAGHAAANSGYQDSEMSGL